MLNEKEIKYFISILEKDNRWLENNIEFFKRNNKEENEREKQEKTLEENNETIIKLKNMINALN